ncbi:MAG: CBS domain-containing protein, partial [Gammaproteobacteria bacterium]|nr:CBS domain-containing protein [Gammaproteobacteria bacterium]
MKTVKEILEAKGTEIWSVQPSDTVLDSLRLMSDKSIGSLLVMDGEKLMGIVTERDYARKVILEGKSSKDTSVSDVMTRKVLCVSPERTVDE